MPTKVVTPGKTATRVPDDDDEDEEEDKPKPKASAADAYKALRRTVPDEARTEGLVLVQADDFLGHQTPATILDFADRARPVGEDDLENAVQLLATQQKVVAEGAGAASRQALGTAVFGGMITSTVLAVFFVPIFYALVQWTIELLNGPPKFHPPAESHSPTATHPPADPRPELPLT